MQNITDVEISALTKAAISKMGLDISNRNEI